MLTEYNDEELKAPADIYEKVLLKSCFFNIRVIFSYRRKWFSWMSCKQRYYIFDKMVKCSDKEREKSKHKASNFSFFYPQIQF